MKSIVLLTLTSLCFSIPIFAQDVLFQRVSDLMPQGYTITGDAYLEELNTGDLVLRLSEDFSTPTGPDVRILLGNSLSLAGAVEIVNLTAISHFSGADTFEVPPTVNILDFDNIIFYCVAFNALWASGTLGDVTNLGGPFPVELDAFKGTVKSPDVLLSWSTAREINNEKFDIEFSTNGTEFQKAGSVFSQNSNSTRQLMYQYVHKNAHAIGEGALYYRLKQTDLDGAFSFSNIIEVELPEGDIAFKLEVYPNPISKNQVLNISKIPFETEVSIFDMSGTLMYTSQNQVNQFKVSLPSGIYFVRHENEVVKLFVLE